MRKFFNFGLLSLLFLAGLPCRADDSQDMKIVEMLRSKAIQSQFEGNADQALSQYQQALTAAKGTYGDNSPYLAEIYYDMGSLCLSNSKFEKADDFLKLALKLNPNSSAAHLRLCELKLLQSRFVPANVQYARAEEAARHAGAVLAKHANDVVAHKELAQAFETKDDSRQAYREYAAVDDLVEGRTVKVAIAAATPPKAKVDETAENEKAQKKAEQDAKKDAAAEAKRKAEQAMKDAAESRKKAEQEKKNGASARKKAEQDAKKKLEQENKRNAEAKKKAEKEKKKKASPAKTPSTTDTVGLPATLSSKAVLLTPVKKKPAAAESTSTVPAEPKKPATPASKPVAAETDETDDTAPVKKTAPAPAKKPKPEPESKPVTPKPGKHAPGLVPPPPPVMPTYTMMPPPQAVVPPKPKPQPKKEEKPKEQPAASQEKPEKGSGSEEDDFLLDWGGAKAKKKK